MPIKVLCPSCGRSGRVPDEAIGRFVQCPACGGRHRLTPADISPAGRQDARPYDVLEVSDDLEILEEEAPSRPTAAPRKSAGPSRAEPRASRPKPAVAADSGAAETGTGRPSANVPWLPIGAAFGAGLLVFAVVASFMGRRGSEPARPSVAAAPPAGSAAVRNEPAPAPSPIVAPTPPAGELVAAVAPASSTPVAVQPEPSSAPAITPAVRQALVPSSTPTAPAYRAPAAGLSTADLVARCEPSVALIKGKAGSGTGFLVAPGILATNSHVIDGEFIRNLEIHFPSADEARRGPLPAELLYEDTKRDLAFLAVKTDLPALVVAGSYQYRKGEDVTVIGNPGVDSDTTLENAISRGVMSSKAELEGQKFYQLGIAVNPGNSGGPVFDPAGEVIGVVTLRIPGKEELSFCIPVEELRAAMTRLGDQTEKAAQQFRATHRLLTAFKNLGSGGAIYGIALELHLALKSNPGLSELTEQVKKLDEAVPRLDQSLLWSLSDEARVARNDPLVPPVTRRKVGELADSYKRLQEAYQAKRTATPIDALRSMKATHRRLVLDLGSTLKVDVPSGLKEALDDHLASGPTVVMQMPVSPGASSLRQRMWERHGIVPPSARARPGIGPSSRTPSRIGPRSRFGR